MNYQPEPIDTSKIKLPDALSELTEKLAKNTHEVWAAGRVQDGWRYGAERNDAEKLHPCLVPYEALPESEKEYDRGTAMETLRLIVKLGYKIIAPDMPAGCTSPSAQNVPKQKAPDDV